MGERRFWSGSDGRCGWQWGSGCAAQSDQVSALLAGREALGLDELDLQVLGVIQVEPSLRGAVGDPSLVPEEGDHLCQERVKFHRRCSACLSRPCES